MPKPRVTGSVLPDLPDSWESYAQLHRQLNPQTISLNSIISNNTLARLKSNHERLANKIGISQPALSAALIGAPPMSSESLAALHAHLTGKGFTDGEVQRLIPEYHIQPKMLDYFVPSFTAEGDFKHRGFGGDSTNGYSGYAIAAHRRCCELQAFIVDGFPKELGKYPLHQHKGQEVLLCLEGEIDVYFWPIIEPKRLAQHDVIYFGDC